MSRLCICCWVFVWLYSYLQSTDAQDQQDVTSSHAPLLKAYFEHKTVIIPHDSKKYRGGEDAAATSLEYLVVADGVGGWASKGINPGLYSKLLTKSILEIGTSNSKIPLVDLVDTANWKAAQQHMGTATCTALQIKGPNTIQTLNIGDSGYSIHRRQKNDELHVVFASKPGQKGFNFPYQIGGKHGDDVKKTAVEMEHSDIQPEDDIIIVYSDGVSDNLLPQEFHPCINDYADDEHELVSLSLVADCIARSAYELGKQRGYLSPFAKEARKAGRANYTGGKHDDITVVVARVRLDGNPAEQTLDDPYYQDSIHLYTGPIPPKADLPKLDDFAVRVEL